MTDTAVGADARAGHIVHTQTGGVPLAECSLAELGELHRALKAALADVKAAMDPVIVREAHRGMTYVELAHTSGYGSFATIARIMRDHPVPKGPRPFR
jgi:sarcosine oxidase delta subunit